MKAQNVLGQFEDAKSLVNTPSALGVILAPLTPALVPKDQPLLAATTNGVESSGRTSAFKSVYPRPVGKSSEGNVLVSRCFLSTDYSEVNRERYCNRSAATVM